MHPFKKRVPFILSLLWPLTVAAQDATVRGVVRSAADGGVVPYATVGWSGTVVATSSDSSGLFTLPLPFHACPRNQRMHYH